jgi:hypothetical protein
MGFRCPVRDQEVDGSNPGPREIAIRHDCFEISDIQEAETEVH